MQMGLMVQGDPFLWIFILSYSCCVTTSSVTFPAAHPIILPQDFISSVYASKEKYDKQCDVQRLPKQTLLEHLDEFIVHRYGYYYKECAIPNFNFFVVFILLSDGHVLLKKK